jgi:thiol-disulfide isomerase/thioredoxin
MRTFIGVLLTLLALQACKQNKQGYHIEVNLDNAGGKWVKLLQVVDRNYVTYDSAFAEAGSPAVLTRGTEGVKTMYLTLEGEDGSVQMLVDNSNYTVSGSLDDPEITSDSKAQNDLNSYQTMFTPLTARMQELIAEIRKGPDPENPAGIDSLREAYYALYDQQDDMDSAYIADNPSSFATVLALRNTFYMLDTEQLEEALTRLDAPLQQMEEYKYMYGKLERMKAVAIGMKYTDFGLETPEGDLLSVSDVHQGNVLMIDFWASWCGPCRRANPEVVEIYNTYHDQGFEILGVSLDRDSASWVQAIADDHLAWKHVSDLKFWNSEGALLYGVPAIPHTVLIDRNGIITAKNLQGDELREAIESLL